MSECEVEGVLVWTGGIPVCVMRGAVRSSVVPGFVGGGRII